MKRAFIIYACYRVILISIMMVRIKIYLNNEALMEFYHLRSFTAVAKTGNLTAAAKQLCITPSAVSAHIKNLEEELNTYLFIRSSKGMGLTTQGKLLLTKAHKTLDCAIEMENLAAENQNEIIGEYHLAINQSTAQLKMATLHQNIHDNCQGIRLNVITSSSGKTIDDIQNNMIDGGYVYGQVPNNLCAIHIKKQNITVITPVVSALTQTSTVTELTNQPWITMGTHCPFDHKLKHLLPNHNIANIHSCDDDTRLSLVISGCGISFLEAEEALQAASKKQVNILPQLDFAIDLFFVVQKKKMNEPIIKAVCEEIKILWGIRN